MGQNGALHGLFVDHAHVLVCQEVQAVQVLLIVLDEQVLRGLVDVNHGLEHHTGTFLYELAHGVQIGGENNAGGHEALVVLAFALAEQLLVPLVHHGEVGLVSGQQLNSLALAVQDVAGGSVLVAVVIRSAIGVLRTGIGSALHQSVDVTAGAGDGQQTHSGEHRVTAAHVVGYHEGGPAFFVGLLLQGAAAAVGSGVDALGGAFLAVTLFQVFLEDPEGQRRLGGGAGLGDHVHADLLALTAGQDVLQVGGRNGVACEEDLRSLLAGAVVHLALDGLDGGAGTQIGAADTDHHQHVGIRADLLGRGLDAGELLLVVIYGQVHPAQEIVAGAGAAFQHLVSSFHLRPDRLKLRVLYKFCKILTVKFNAHIAASHHVFSLL